MLPYYDIGEKCKNRTRNTFHIANEARGRNGHSCEKYTIAATPFIRITSRKVANEIAIVIFMWLVSKHAEARVKQFVKFIVSFESQSNFRSILSWPPPSSILISVYVCTCALFMWRQLWWNLMYTSVSCSIFFIWHIKSKTQMYILFKRNGPAYWMAAFVCTFIQVMCVFSRWQKWRKEEKKWTTIREFTIRFALRCSNAKMKKGMERWVRKTGPSFSYVIKFSLLNYFS